MPTWALGLYILKYTFGASYCFKLYVKYYDLLRFLLNANKTLYEK